MITNDNFLFSLQYKFNVRLKRLAKSLGVDLVFIDLRWGLTSVDSSEGWVIRILLTLFFEIFIILHFIK